MDHVTWRKEGLIELGKRRVLMVRSADGNMEALLQASSAPSGIITSNNWNPAWADRVVCPPGSLPLGSPTRTYLRHRYLEPTEPSSGITPTPATTPSRGTTTRTRVWTYDRGGMEKHRLAGEYLGVPPT